MLKMVTKLTSAICSLSLVLGMIFLGGAVSAAEATPISTKEELNSIRNNLSGSYYLTCDIVFTEADFVNGGSFYNSGKGFTPIGTSKKPFTGSFDGKGYSIVGLKTSVSGKMYNIVHTNYDGTATIANDGWTGDYIIGGNTANTSPAIGLFGFNKGEIKNLTLYDFSVKGIPSNSSTSYIGGIAGYNVGLIEACSAYGIVSGDKNSHCGGIAGYLNNGQISDCYSFANVNSTGKKGVLLGSARKGFVKNVYSKSYDDIKTIGQIINADSVSLQNSYYVSAVDKTVGIGNRISPENGKTATSFAGFDFENVWMISKYQTPILRSSVSAYKVASVTGDADRNGKINLSDVSLVAQKVAGWDVDPDIDAANTNRDFDADGNNKITLSDVSLLAQNIAGWDSAELF